MLKACPSYAQTEVQVVHEAGGSTKVQHEKLCQPGHKALCLAFALQGMSQKHMQSAAAASSMQKPISVHDAPSLQPSSDLAIAVIGCPSNSLMDSCLSSFMFHDFRWDMICMHGLPGHLYTANTSLH